MTDFLKVGSTVIPVAPGGGGWDWSDAVDRRRAFDNTARASATGGAARDGRWTTPPVSRANAGIYRAVLQKVDAQLCSGDSIEVPTMCLTQLLREVPVKQSVGQLVTLDFALSEVQPKKLLLKYSPGDTITGESFTRSTTAYQTDINGVLASKAINAKRDGHYIGGVVSTLLEDARTNLLLRSQELDNAAWTATATVTPNAATAPDGTATAETVNDTSGAATQNIHQDITVANDAATRTGSIFLKAGSSSIIGLSLVYSGGTGKNYGIVINLATGATLTQNGQTAPSLVQVTALGSSWYRVAISGANNGLGNTTLSLYCYPAWNSSFLAAFSDAATGSVNAWGGQIENGSFASSYIPTTTVAVTRGADSYSLPFTTPPQEMTVYAKWVELGTITASKYLWEIADATDSNPRFLLWSNGTAYQVFHGEPSLSTTSTQGTAPVIGDTDEIVARLHGDGSVSGGQSINGAAETSSAQSGPNLLASLWSGQLVWLNSAGTVSRGFVALQSFKIVAGARSLADMRAA